MTCFCAHLTPRACLPCLAAVAAAVDALNAVAQGVLRGAGRPGIGALLNTAAYWGLSLPLAWYFGLRLDWSVKGFWAALLITSALMSVVHSAVILRLNWEQEVQRAAKRIAKHEEQAAVVKGEGLQGVLAQAVLIRSVSSPVGSEFGVQEGGEEGGLGVEVCVESGEQHSSG